MALTPDDNEAFFREVDERLREQQYIDLWKNYGTTIVAAVILILAAVGAVLVWQSRQRAHAETQAEQLTAVLSDVEGGKLPNPAQLAPLKSADASGYRVASRLLEADLALRGGNIKAAVAGFGAIASDTSLSQPYRELALVRQTAAEFDQLPTATVVARMKPLAVAGGPWLGSAGEMLAAAYIRDGKPALAAPVFALIAKDDQAPSSLRSRSEQMAAMLGSNAGVPAAKD